MTDKLTRRTLGGLAAAGVGLPLLAACGGDDPGTASDPSTPGAGSSAPESPGASTSGSAGSSGGTKGFTTTEDIPVGGGAIFADEKVVVTQPTAGDFKCFTAVCSHQGCLVNEVSDGTINCDCHGSQFDIETGEVVQGPATFALEEEQITVSGDQISLA